jgi:hypothetical protein
MQRAHRNRAHVSRCRECAAAKMREFRASRRWDNRAGKYVNPDASVRSLP